MGCWPAGRVVTEVTWPATASRAESLKELTWLITAVMDVDAVTATQSHDQPGDRAGKPPRDVQRCAPAPEPTPLRRREPAHVREMCQSARPQLRTGRRGGREDRRHQRLRPGPEAALRGHLPA